MQLQQISWGKTLYARWGKRWCLAIELDLLLQTIRTLTGRHFWSAFFPIMLKFDSLVGDWGNGQLQFEGFTKDDKPVKPDPERWLAWMITCWVLQFWCAIFVWAMKPGFAEPEDKPHLLNATAPATTASAENRNGNKQVSRLPRNR